MKHAIKGNPINLQDNEVVEITDVADITNRNGISPAIRRINANSMLFASSTFDRVIKQYSIVGIETADTIPFEYRSLGYRPAYDSSPNDSHIEFAFDDKPFSVQGLRAVKPEYWHHNGMIGVLQSDLEPDGGAWARIYGQTLALVDVKSKFYIDVGMPDKDYFPLVPKDSYLNTDTEFALELDVNRATLNDYGAIRLLHPGAAVMDYDESDPADTPEYYIPAGPQHAVVFLGTVPSIFWDEKWSNYLL